MPDEDAAWTSGLPDLSRATLRSLRDRSEAAESVLDSALDRLLSAEESDGEPSSAGFGSRI